MQGSVLDWEGQQVHVGLPGLREPPFEYETQDVCTRNVSTVNT